MKKGIKKSAKSKKKTAVKKVVKKPKKFLVQKPIGEVTHFYGNIKVAVIKFKKDVKKGAEVRFGGATTDFSQVFDSMQYNHVPVLKAQKGKSIGVKVKKRVRVGDKVYLEE